MNARFARKVALVTGGGDGMGRATVERLASEGARVFALDRDGGKARAVADAQRALGRTVDAITADVMRESELVEAFARLEREGGGLDVLINVAGGSKAGYVADLPSEEWDRLYALNLRSTAICCRLAVALMRRRGGGSIVNMSSISGLRGDPGWAAYNAAKAAIISLTQSLAWEVGRDGIRINAICPGPIASQRMVESLPDRTLIDAYNAACAIGRMGRPEELAAAICFLASDEASFITGAALVADGGLTARTGQPFVPPG